MSILLLFLAIPFYWAGMLGGFWAVVGLFVTLFVLETLIRHAVKSRRNFRYLSPLEQSLRRASQGFALSAFSLLGIVVPYVWLYGWRKFLALLPWMLDHPGEAWPVFACAGLFAIGLVRFLAAVPQCVGARDGIRRPSAAVKLTFGIGVAGYLMLTYPWGEFGATAVGFYTCVFAYAVGLWCALVGAVRFALLSISTETAPDRMATHIGQQSTPWRIADQRPWWKFWQK
jgi:hypothetical protein